MYLSHPHDADGKHSTDAIGNVLNASSNGLHKDLICIRIRIRSPLFVPHRGNVHEQQIVQVRSRKK